MKKLSCGISFNQLRHACALTVLGFLSVPAITPGVLAVTHISSDTSTPQVLDSDTDYIVDPGVTMAYTGEDTTVTVNGIAPVNFTNNGTITNTSTASAALLFNVQSNITNAGTITGGTGGAIVFASTGNTLNLQTTSVVTGAVSTGVATGNTLNLFGGSSASGVVNNAFSGAGFESMTVNAPATVWDFQSNLTLSNAITVNAGSLIVTGNITSANGVIINSGASMQIGNGTNVGNFSGNITVNGELILFHADNNYHTNDNIGGTGVIRLQGTGLPNQSSYDFSGSHNTFTGSLIIENGARLHTSFSPPLPVSHVTVNNGGTLWLGSSDVFSSPISLEGNGWTESNGRQYGALRLDSNATASGSITLTGDTRIGAVFSDYAGTISGDISDGGNGYSLEKTGDGEIILSGNSTYTGATSISDGVLRIDGTLGNTAVTVANTAVLSGVGTIAGSVTIFSGGHLRPGDSPGTITVGSLDLNSGSSIDYELGTPGILGGGVNDLTIVTGNLTISGTLNITAQPGFGSGLYRLFNYGGTLTNQGLILGTLPSGYSASDIYVQTLAPNQINLIVKAGLSFNYWDGTGTLNDGSITGGAETWIASDGNGDRWATGDGAINAGWTQGAVAMFGYAAAGQVAPVAAGGIVTVDNTVGGQIVIGGASFNVSGYTIQGGDLQLGSSPAQFTVVNSSDTATIASNLVGGTSGIVKNGLGVLALTGINTYTGGTVIHEGTLDASANAALGTGNITFDDTADPTGRLLFSGTTTNTHRIIVNSGVTGNLTAASGQTLTVTTPTLANNGGAIILGANAAIKIIGNVTFLGNQATASGSGGAIYAGVGSHLNFSSGDIVFTNNQAAANGGAIYTAGDINFNGSPGNITLNANAAVTSGGAVYSLGNITLSGNYGNLSITGNSVQNSGGGALFSGNTISIGGTYNAITIDSNTTATTTSSGGALLGVLGITVNPSVTGDLAITNNRATNYSAGAFYSDRFITINSAVGGMLNISGNSSVRYGGALQTGSGGTDITLSGSYGSAKISGNTAALGGGAFIAQRNILFTNITSVGDLEISNNSVTAGSGGALSGSNIIFSGNTVGGTLSFLRNTATGSNGGAIFASTNISIDGSYAGLRIDSNAATGNGGAFSDGGTLSILASVSGNLDITNNQSAGNGGAFNSSGAFSITSNIGGNLNIANNQASGTGGFVYVINSNSSITINPVAVGTITINKNTAGSQISNAGGGALSLPSGNVLIGTVAGNVALTNNVASSSGGGMLVGGTNLGNVTIGNANGTVTISGNYAGYYYNTSNVLTVKALGQNGGGIFSTGNGASASKVTLTGKGISLTGNRATGSGGAIYSANGIFIVGNTGDFLAQSNVTSSNAGALFTFAGGVNVSGTFDNIAFLDNSSTGSGGAIFASGGRIGFDSVTAQDFLIQRNSANGGGAFSAVDVTITGNYNNITIGGTNAVDGNKTTGGNAGAIFSGGVFTINTNTTGALTVANNTASSFGGAFIASSSGAGFSLLGNYDSILFASNTAGSDGGFLYGNGAVSLSPASVGTFTVSNNRATSTNSKGGAIFSTNSFSLNLPAGSTFTATGNTTSNIANGGFLYTGSGAMNFNIGAGATATIGRTDGTSTGGIDSIGAAAGVPLNKTGTGLLALYSSSTYAGATNANAGVLAVFGNVTGTGTVNVATDAILAGTGTIGSVASQTTVATGGHLSPGAYNLAVGTSSAGRLTIGGNLTFADSGSNLDLNLATANVIVNAAGTNVGAGNDLVQVNGSTVELNSATLNIASAGATVTPGYYRLINFNSNGGSAFATGTLGTITVNGTTLDAATRAGYYVQTSVSGQVNLIVTAGLTINCWDGTGALNDGNITGGTQTWVAGNGNGDRWTTADGAINAGWTTGAIAMFGYASPTQNTSTTPVTPGGTVTIDNTVGGSVVIGGASFNVSGYTLQGGDLQLITTAASQFTVVNANDTATIASKLTTGTQGIVKNGAGTLVLAGANTYSGGTTIHQGTLSVGADTALGSGNVIFDNTAIGASRLLFSQTATGTHRIVVNANAVGTLAAAAGTTLTVTVPGVQSSGTATLVNSNGTLILDGNVTYANNQATGPGGAISLQPGATLNLQNGTARFAGNNANGDGGAIYGVSAVTISGSNESIEVQGNSAGTARGGAIFAANGNISLTGNYSNILIADNTAGQSGGAFSTWNTSAANSISINTTTAGSLTVRNNISTGSIAGFGGGAFFIQSGSGGTINILGNYGSIALTGNQALNGSGGVITSYGSAITINTSTTGALTITGNTADRQGGAFNGNNFSLLGSYGSITIDNNTAGLTANGPAGVDAFGGGAIITSTAAINATVTGTLSLSNNSSISVVGGGAVQSANFNLGGSYGGIVIDDNTARSYSRSSGTVGGGAVLASSNILINPTVAAGGLSFTNNAVNVTDNAGSRGGVLSATGTITLSANTTGDLLIGHNTATSSYANASNAGGAFYAGQSIIINGSYGDITIDGNTVTGTAGGNGGAFYAGQSITINPASVGIVAISNNSVSNASRSGGALYAGQNITIIPGAAGTLSIDHNTAGLYGGAFYASGNVILGSSGGTVSITNNQASLGGAIYAFGTVSLSGKVSLIDNTATGVAGGAIWAVGTVRVDGSLIANSNKTQGSSGSSAAGGGAILAYGNPSPASVVVTNAVSMDGNQTAIGNGGAIYANAGDVNLGFVSGDVSLTNNSASGSGGAIYADDSLGAGVGNVNLGNASGIVTITGNQAGGSGGAINVRDNATLTGASIALSNNTSGNHGGGIYTTGSVTINGTLVMDGNTAGNGSSGGGIYTASGSVAINGSLKASGNSAWDGGAIYVNGSISVNDSVDLRSNIATGSGGGAMFATSNISLAGFSGDVILADNAGESTFGYGGALGAFSGITLGNAASTINIIGNTSGNGGAIASIFAPATLSGANITIADNTATGTTGKGGAIYTGGDFTLNLSAGGTFLATGNVASNPSNGGFLYTDSGTITFNIGTAATATVGGDNAATNGTDSIDSGAGVNLVKDGAGTLILNSVNGYQGETIIDNGTLVLTNALAASSGRVNINTATGDITQGLDLAFFNDGTFANLLAGAGTTRVSGDGTATITGINVSSYTGLWQITGSAALAAVSTDSHTNLGSGSVNIDAAGRLSITTPANFTFQNELTGAGLLSVDLGESTSQFIFDSAAGDAFAGTVAIANATYNFSAANNASAMSAAVLRLDTGGIARLDAEHAIGNMAFNGGLFDVVMATPTVAHILTVNDLDVDYPSAPATPGSVNLDFSGLGLGGLPPVVATPTGNFLDQDDVETNGGIQVAKAVTVSSAGKQLTLLVNNSAPADQTKTVTDSAGNSDVRATYGYMAVTTLGDQLATGAGMYVAYVLKVLESRTNLVLDNTGANDNTLGAQLTGLGNIEFRANNGTILLNNGANNYTGATTIASGTVIAGTDNAFGHTSQLTIATGATVDLNGNTQTVGAFIGNTGSILDLADGTLTLTADSVSNGVMQGTGTLVIDPSILTVHGANPNFHAAINIDPNSGAILDHVQGLGDGAITYADDTGFVELAGTSGTFANNLNGAGIFRLTGNADVALSANNTAFSGQFVITTGSTLTAAAPGQLGGASILADGTLSLSGYNNPALNNILSGTGVVALVNNSSVALNAANPDFSGTFSVSNNSGLAVSNSAQLGTASIENVGRFVANAPALFIQGSLANTGAVYIGGSTSTTVGNTLRVGSNYTGTGMIYMNATLGDDASPSDKLTIDGDASGRTVIHLTNIGGAGAQTNNGIKLIEVGGSNLSGTGTFVLDGGKMSAGMYDYSLYLGDKSGTGSDWFLRSTSQLSPQGASILGTAAGNGLGWHTELDTLLKRMGDLRLAPVRDMDGTHGFEAWVRAYGWQNNVNSRVTGQPFTEYYYGADAGTDKAYRLDDGWFYAGGFAGGGQARRDFNGSGKGHTDAVRGGFYFTYLDDTGWYADLVTKVGHYENHFEAQTNNTMATGKYEIWGYGAALEFGKRLTSAKGWFAEPQVQLSYGHLTDADYTTEGDPLRVNVEKQDSFQLRGGVVFGKNLPTEVGILQPYAKASVASMWTDGGQVSTDDGFSRRSTMDGARVELGTGIVWQTNGYGQFYFDYEYILAERFEIPWKLNGGYRLQW